jgi:hypothetical protein
MPVVAIKNSAGAPLHDLATFGSLLRLAIRALGLDAAPELGLAVVEELAPAVGIVERVWPRAGPELRELAGELLRRMHHQDDVRRELLQALEAAQGLADEVRTSAAA